MNIRRATVEDEPVLRELWQEFEAEVPEPAGDPEPWEEEWRDTRRDIEHGTVLIAEDGEGPVAVARAEAVMRRRAHVQMVYVRPRARRSGVTKTLLSEVVREARAGGADWISLDVLTANETALAVWRRLGFEELAHWMATPVDALEQRLAGPHGVTFGSIHVQTDDHHAVVREVEKYRPRIAPPAQMTVTGPANGWISFYDELLEQDPRLLQRLAKELSNALGSVVACFTIEQETAVGYSIYDRGRSVDDYLSLPEFRGPLPPGDVVAMAANPRVVQRLTGADPAQVRAVARTASSPEELPPARELAAQIAATMGISGAERGFRDAQ